MNLGLKSLLLRGESFRSKPYLDCCGKYWRECTCEKKGKLTFAIGRNLDDDGITFDEAMQLCENDVSTATTLADKHLPWFPALNEPRQAVILSMIFNQGLGGLLTFKHFLAAMAAQDWAQAKSEMLSSLWAKQVGERAQELAAIVETGQFPTEQIGS